MAESITIKDIYNELKSLRKDINYIKSRIDNDSLMTREECAKYDESIDELKKGKTTSLSNIKKELGI